jgi:hypothetical protein
MTDTTAIERTQLLSKIAVNSDAGQIQERGGLYVEDPGQAEMQAQNEDIEMLEMRAVQTSFGDNHQVHLETHSQALALALSNVMAQKKGMKVDHQVSATSVELMQEHIRDHINDMRAIQLAPGLVPNDQMGTPNPPTLTPQHPQSPQEPGEPQKTQQKVSPVAKARLKQPPKSATIASSKIRKRSNAKRNT